jgi:hypothetical protein
MPAMNYQQEYNRGPLHVGRLDLVLRGYAWTKEELDKYKRMKREEDFRLLSYIDNSIRIAMESLGEELIAYLKEAGEDFSDDPDAFTYISKPSEKKDAPSDPFTSIFKGFGEMFGAGGGHHGLDKFGIKKGKDKAKKEFSTTVWNTYKDFKKSFRLLNW